MTVTDSTGLSDTQTIPITVDADLATTGLALRPECLGICDSAAGLAAKCVFLRTENETLPGSRGDPIRRVPHADTHIALSVSAKTSRRHCNKGNNHSFEQHLDKCDCRIM